MGLFGMVSSLWRGRPKPPKPEPREPDPYARSYQQRGAIADRATHRLLMQELGREPGYTPEEYRAITEYPKDIQRRSEQLALRRQSQLAGHTGRFGSSGHIMGRGQIMGEGQRIRRGIDIGGASSAAAFARADRARQIGMGSQYALPRQAIGQQETGDINRYKEMLNNMAMQAYQQELAQYNQDLMNTINLLTLGYSGMMGMRAGGGGGGMASGPSYGATFQGTQGRVVY